MNISSLLSSFLVNLQDFFAQHLLLSIGLLLLVGYFFAKLAALCKLPEITGFIISGIVLGESGLGLLSHHTGSDLSLITEITLGLIALTIGGEFYWVKLKSMGKGIFLITLVQLVTAFLTTTLGLFLFKMELPFAMLLGAIATATAPAATVAIVQSLNATGKFVDYLYGVVALDDAGAVIIFGIVFAVVSAVAGPGAAQSAAMGGGETLLIIGEALFEVVASVALGVFSGFLIHSLVRKNRKQNDILIISIGLVFLTIGTTTVFHLSPLLTNMAAGAALINLGARNHRIFHILEPLTPPMYALFFVLAGTELDLSVLADTRVLILGLVYIAFRAVGKYGGVVLGARLSRASPGITRYLGLCMLPQAGVAIGLTLIIQTSPFGEYLSQTQGQVLSDILNIVLISVFINEIFGPPISKTALVKGLEMEE